MIRSSFAAAATVASVVALASACSSSSTNEPGATTDGGTSTTGGATTGGSSASCDKSPPPSSCVGAEAPSWALEDFQPKSPKFQQRYGLEAFRGHPTVVAFMASWCPYCQSQLARMDAMSREFLSDGKSINFVILNKADAVSTQANFTSRCEFPLFQDTNEALVFTKHSAAKDDILLYGSDGKLAAFLVNGGRVNTNLSTAEGYEATKNAILAVK